MKTYLAKLITFTGLCIYAAQGFSQVEPVYPTGYPWGTFTRIKCPASGMSFTEGIPIRVLADGIDSIGTPQAAQADHVEFYADGLLKVTDGHLRGINHFEAIVKGLTVGSHTLTSKSYNYGGVIRTSPFPVVITINPMPVKANTITLTSNIQLSGSTNLDWQNVVVKGNGYRVTSDLNWTGNVIIKNAFITGLAVTVDSVPTTTNAANAGIDVTTTGSVTIDNSIFEWTGANYFTVNGSGNVSIRKNEFRASAFIPYVSDDPGRSPVVRFFGSSTAAKVFQGNKVGAGHLQIHYMGNWLIGGDADSLSNIFIGPRTGVRIESCHDITVKGNYSRHDYYGGWSQGFNFFFENNTEPFLCEHNIIRQGSWPVQSISGTFRYNLVVGCGHHWLRTALTGAEIYRNVFIQPERAASAGSGVWFGYDQTNIKVHNNTFDGGGPQMLLQGSAIAISKGSHVTLLRNNLFTEFPTPTNTGAVDRAIFFSENDSVDRITYADYNCFYNPDAAIGSTNYGNFLVAGKNKGTTGYGGNDLGGVNGQVDPKIKQGASIPYHIEEDKVWKGTLKVSEVLADFRNRYMPQNTSALVDAGDPLSGAGVDIGAVEAANGTQQTDDLFGKFGSSITTGVAAVASSLPGFKMQVMPNPFSNNLEIQYQIPAGNLKNKVSIQVYTMQGILIASLLDKNQSEGNYDFNWDATSIPSGVYLIKLQINNEVNTARVVLMK